VRSRPFNLLQIEQAMSLKLFNHENQAYITKNTNMPILNHKYLANYKG
jgi:hypothetical protein